MFLLQYKYWKSAPTAASYFLNNTPEILEAVHALLHLMQVEQNHFRDSAYYYKELPRRFKDGTGMVWSFARPSDDQVVYGYNVPQNLMAVAVLGKLCEMNEALWNDAIVSSDTTSLQAAIENGIRNYGLVPNHGGLIFAFEVDGWGNTSTDVLDDANMPNLLWQPYLGQVPAELRDIYQRTRSVILSQKNVNWFTDGTENSSTYGLGSQHASTGLRPIWPGEECTENNCIWHLGLIMQALSSKDPRERNSCLEQVVATAWHGLMHEGFSSTNTSNYNRDYFGWANSLFAEWVQKTWVPHSSHSFSLQTQVVSGD